MATLARNVGGGLDPLIAMTGHKDIKLADHDSTCDEEDQKNVSLKVMDFIRKHEAKKGHDTENVISLFGKKMATQTFWVLI